MLPCVPTDDYRSRLSSKQGEVSDLEWQRRASKPSSQHTSLKVGSAADIPLDIGERDLSQLTASLTTPSGPEEPCLLKMLRNAHIGISFAPKEIGEHLVNIKKNGRHVPSSPIAVMIKQSGIGDVSRVRVSGPWLTEDRTFQP
ncbi:filamin-A-like [Oreochromis niloticus]|uniref:filamin-A-like n=1 Tax=Oreochromis niloticus TaxID=8128 RepID=UPI000DF130F1|nr:filamin-A-like [Oreochromis niloticus]XP_025760441.1 filamin-A-like [Oreochromis niloticus]XP_025760442.1 filamin-A-like [Oreochromis niloticus]XP_025760443.1 filamin-A-like [Oreochromis niloticus]